MQPLWKTLCRFAKKLKTELPYNPAIPLLGIYRKKKTLKTLIQKDACTPVFTGALQTIAKIWMQSECPSADEWMKKMWHIYIYIYTYTHKMEYNSAIKKNKILSFATMWMEQEGIYLNKSEREIQILSDIIGICGI